MQKGVRQIKNMCPDSLRILVVAHGGVIRALFDIADAMDKIRWVENCPLTKWTLEDKGKLVYTEE